MSRLGVHQLLFGPTHRFDFRFLLLVSLAVYFFETNETSQVLRHVSHHFRRHLSTTAPYLITIKTTIRTLFKGDFLKKSCVISFAVTGKKK